MFFLINGKACAGTGEQVHLIIFTCARYAHEVRTRKKNEEGRKKKRKKEKEWELQEKKRWREEKDYRKTEIQRKIPGKFTISKEGLL